MSHSPGPPESPECPIDLTRPDCGKCAAHTLMRRRAKRSALRSADSPAPASTVPVPQDNPFDFDAAPEHPPGAGAAGTSGGRELPLPWPHVYRGLQLLQAGGALVGVGLAVLLPTLCFQTAVGSTFAQLVLAPFAMFVLLIAAVIVCIGHWMVCSVPANFNPDAAGLSFYAMLRRRAYAPRPSASSVLLLAPLGPDGTPSSGCCFPTRPRPAAGRPGAGKLGEAVPVHRRGTCAPDRRGVYLVARGRRDAPATNVIPMRIKQCSESRGSKSTTTISALLGGGCLLSGLA